MPPIVAFGAIPGLCSVVWIGVVTLIRYLKEPNALAGLAENQLRVSRTRAIASSSRHPDASVSKEPRRYYILCDLEAFVCIGWIAAVISSIVANTIRTLPSIISESIWVRLAVFFFSMTSICVAIAVSYQKRRYFEIEANRVRHVYRRWWGRTITTSILLAGADSRIDLRGNKLVIVMGTNSLEIPLHLLDRPFDFIQEVMSCTQVMETEVEE